MPCSLSANTTTVLYSSSYYYYYCRYLLNSGISALWQDYVWWVTAEGDTVVMQMQMAKFLMKVGTASVRP